MARMGIGALSRNTGCNIETIRYYERIGLLAAPPRSAGGHRVYGDEHVRRLGFVRRGRELGFPLDTVRALLACADEEEGPCAHVRALSADHLADVRRRIADLRRLEKALAEMVRRCEGADGNECPILDALCVAGPAPR